VLKVSFEEELKALVSLAGFPDSNLDDEHTRWEIYRRIVPLPGVRDHLRSVLKDEPIQNVAAAAVVELFGHLPPGERASWVKILKPEVRDFPIRRMLELEIVEKSHAGRLRIESVNITDWSDWLQRRIIESTNDSDSLRKLAAEGRTKAIRANARNRLRGMPPSAGAR
jgi:hypothetical protein